MYSCTWTCHNYLEFNVLRFANAPTSRHVCFFLWSLWLYFAKVWHMNKSNLFFFGLSKIGDGCFFFVFLFLKKKKKKKKKKKFFSIVIFSLRVVAENNGLYDPLLDLYILQAEFIPNSVFPGGPSVTHYFIWWLLGTNVSLICVQYIDKNGQYNKCHKVSCFTQDKLT